MIANLQRQRFLFLPLLAVLTVILLSACASSPGQRAEKPKIRIPVESIPEPVPAKPEQFIDLDAFNAVRTIGLQDGPLAAWGERNALLVRGLDATTSALIDSFIAWLEGDLEQAERLLKSINASNREVRALVLQTQQQRAELSGDFLAAAQFAFDRLNLAEREQESVANELWNALMSLDDGQLQAALRSSASSNRDWRSWLELNRSYRQGRSAVRNWLASHTEHAAVTHSPAALNRWLNARAPATVAVLLPLSGRLQAAGEAVLEGIIESLYLQYREPEQRPRLLTVDSNDFPDAIAAYRDAVRQGADLVLGPLTKANARTLGNLRQRPVPVIALNRPEALAGEEAQNWSALSLAPEDEARQIANMAFGEGLRRALIIRPDTEWGRRLDAALSQTWRGLGGRIVNTLALTSEPTPSEQISQLVGTAGSEARITAVERAFEAPVEARPRRRQDFDVIFMLAPDPAEARSLRPLLVYHFSGDIPVYAPSTVNSGHLHLQNRDLNDLITVEIPAVLEAIDVNRFTRLRALGHDAVSLMEHADQIQVTTAAIQRGETGILHRRANGEIERRLDPAVFDGGELRRLHLP